ncbi:hypothetical protein MPSI1_003033 [Malassezia psittaci]|uniref:Uncharacterized protein n=1 Tax=Malassezia psittaci TaxID=1821823 RepID=A0AAF0F8N8_9BASI|nr:hypothetical protein MPSI1_003033 [Malassezia psittaci]
MAICMPRRALKTGDEAEAARSRLRNQCRKRIEQERSKKKSLQIERFRVSAAGWWQETVQAEAQNASNLSEEAIGRILREEWEEAKLKYEEDNLKQVGEFDIEQMLALEEEIRTEQSVRHDTSESAGQNPTITIDDVNRMEEDT